MSTDRELIEEIRDDVRGISQVLKGYNGQVGLCKQVEKHTREIAKLWIILLVLIATLGGSGYGILKLILK